VVKEGMPDWIDRMVAVVGEDARVKRFDLPGLKASIEGARTAVDAFNDKVPDWEFPVDFAKERADYYKHLAKYETACCQVWRHVEAVTQPFNSVK